MIGDAGFPGEGNGDDIERLIVVEGTEHELVELFGPFGSSVFRRSGLVYGQCASFDRAGDVLRRHVKPSG
jgi:hypothetical protein